jgi:thiol:disulfide interchange protein
MSVAINWWGSWDAALTEAAKEKRPVVLELYLDGCPHCLKLDQETHKDPAVAAALNTRFIPVRLEGRGHMDLVRQLKVPGAPTTLIFSPAGQELHRFAGFKPPQEYLEELKKFG